MRGRAALHPALRRLVRRPRERGLGWQLALQTPHRAAVGRRSAEELSRARRMGCAEKARELDYQAVKPTPDPSRRREGDRSETEEILLGRRLALRKLSPWPSDRPIASRAPCAATPPTLNASSGSAYAIGARRVQVPPPGQYRRLHRGFPLCGETAHRRARRRPARPGRRRRTTRHT